MDNILLKSSGGHIKVSSTFQHFIAFGFAYLTRGQLQNLAYDMKLYESLKTYVCIINQYKYKILNICLQSKWIWILNEVDYVVI